MQEIERSESLRLMLHGLLIPLKLAYFDDPEIYRALGCQYALAPPAPEKPRWLSQMTDAATLDAGTELECDAVVVGTGAGGAAVATGLAKRGHAVLLVEEGAHFTRADFNGRPMEMMQKLYRQGGLTAAVGNTVIPIPLGKGVGGTTLINSGTCLRLPESTLAHWRDDLGLTEFTSETLAPYYDRGGDVPRGRALVETGAGCGGRADRQGLRRARLLAQPAAAQRARAATARGCAASAAPPMPSGRRTSPTSRPRSAAGAQLADRPADRAGPDGGRPRGRRHRDGRRAAACR